MIYELLRYKQSYNSRLKSDVQNYWRPMKKEGWMAEINDMKSMLMMYGKIPEETIKVSQRYKHLGN